MDMHCVKCGHTTISQITKFQTWYTDGETWWEDCGGCDRHYRVELRTYVDK